MTTEKMKLKKIPFDVLIPNLDGDGIASTVQIEVQAYSDPETGEDVLTPESVDLIEKTQARHMGLMTAEDIKALRTRLDLSQDEMSELLQIGAKSYTRWESGRARPSRSMNVMLCALRDGQLGVNYLRALRNPATHGEWSARPTLHKPHHVFLSYSACQPSEPKVPWQALFPKGKPELLELWSHLWTEEDVLGQCLATINSANKSSTTEALIKAFLTSDTTHDQPATPSAPRLPSSRDQRQTFMNHRFHIPETEDSVPG